MKNIDIGQGISILANVGVIAGIVFLGLEIQQNTAVLQATSRQAALDNSLQSLQFVSENPEIWLSIAKPELTESERVALSAYLFGTLRRAYVYWQQYQLGALDEVTWQNFCGIVISELQYPQSLKWWKFFSSRGHWDPAFSAEIDDLLASTPIETRLLDVQAFE